MRPLPDYFGYLLFQDVINGNTLLWTKLAVSFSAKLAVLSEQYALT